MVLAFISIVAYLLCSIGLGAWDTAAGLVAKGLPFFGGKKKRGLLSFVPIVGDLIGGGGSAPSRPAAPAISPAVEAAAAAAPAQPTQPTPEETAEQEEQRRRARRVRTLLTGAEGVVGNAPVQRKTLLGA